MRVSDVLKAWQKSRSVFDKADAATVAAASKLFEGEEFVAAFDGLHGVEAAQRALTRAIIRAEAHEGPRRRDNVKARAS